MYKIGDIVTLPHWVKGKIIAIKDNKYLVRYDITEYGDSIDKWYFSADFRC